SLSVRRSCRWISWDFVWLGWFDCISTPHKTNEFRNSLDSAQRLVNRSRQRPHDRLAHRLIFAVQCAHAAGFVEPLRLRDGQNALAGMGFHDSDLRALFLAKSHSHSDISCL